MKNNNFQYINFFVNITSKNNDQDSDNKFPHYVKAVVIEDSDIENFINEVMSQEYYHID